MNCLVYGSCRLAIFFLLFGTTCDSIDAVFSTPFEDQEKSANLGSDVTFRFGYTSIKNESLSQVLSCGYHDRTNWDWIITKRAFKPVIPTPVTVISPKYQNRVTVTVDMTVDNFSRIGFRLHKVQLNDAGSIGCELYVDSSPLFSKLYNLVVQANPCSRKPCKNSGTCVEKSQLAFEFECVCKEGYGGKACQYLYGDRTVSVTLQLKKARYFNETAFRLEIARVLNNFCTKSPASCFKKGSIKKSPERPRQDLAKYVFKQADITFLPGYPKTKADDVVVVNFFVALTTFPSKLGNPEASEALIALDPDTVVKSLEAVKDTSSFHVQSAEVVISINKKMPESTTQDKTTSDKTTLGKKTSDKTNSDQAVPHNSQRSSRGLLSTIAVLASVIVIGFLYMLWWRARRMSLKETRIREERRRNEESSGILQQETAAIQVNHAYVDCGKETEKTTTPEEVEMEPNDSGFTYSALQTDEV